MRFLISLAQLKKMLCLLLPLLHASCLLAEVSVDTYPFHSLESQRRAMALARELRCPQCQNQNLLESNATIARDLRLEVYQQIDSGKSDEAVIAYMTDRFGEFVRYSPPLNTGTALLWGAPILLLLCASWVLWRMSRGSPPGEIPPPAAEPAQGFTSTRRAAITAPPRPPVRYPYLVKGLMAAALLLPLAWYAQSGRWQAARGWHDTPDPLIGLGGEELKDAAQQRLEALIRANPRDLEAWAQLGQLYLYRDQFALALEAYDRLATQEGTMSASTLAAKATVLYYQAGQRLTPQARQLLDAALAKDPGEVTALMLEASDLFLNTRYEEAIAVWQRLLDEGRPRVNREAAIRAIQTARMLIR